MERENMERTFCWKISAELKGFEYRMKQKDNESIVSEEERLDNVVYYYRRMPGKIEIAENLRN